VGFLFLLIVNKLVSSSNSGQMPYAEGLMLIEAIESIIDALEDDD